MYDDDEEVEDVRLVEKERRRKALEVKNKDKEADKWSKQKRNVSSGRDRRRDRQELREMLRGYR